MPLHFWFAGSRTQTELVPDAASLSISVIAPTVIVPPTDPDDPGPQAVQPGVITLTVGVSDPTAGNGTVIVAAGIAEIDIAISDPTAGNGTVIVSAGVITLTLSVVDPTAETDDSGGAPGVASLSITVVDPSVRNTAHSGDGPPFLGGFAITAADWPSLHALRVLFTTTYGSLYCYQLYAGRTLIGATRAPTDREIIGQLVPSDWPQWIQLVAVLPADRARDFGDRLPPRPYNRVRLRWATGSWPADADVSEITAGTTPGGAVDSGNVLSLVPFDVDRTYEFLTDPLEGSGTWNFEVAGRDNRPTGGNKGTALELAAAIYSTPPDVEIGSDGTRLTVAIASQQITVSFTE